MPRHRLTSEWSIDLDDTFQQRVVDGDLQMVSMGPPTRTLWLAVWGPPPEEAPEDVLRVIKENVPPDPVQRFEEEGADEHECRYASWYAETVDDRQQWGLYAYTVRRGSYVQLAVLLDTADDLDWALQTWRSLRYRDA